MRNVSVIDNDCGKLINKQLTGKLIKLHSMGYDLDFYLNCNNYCLVCLQTGEQFTYECIMVKLVDLVYDFITNSFKYLHTVETVCGDKGILIMEGIYSLNCSYI